MSPPRTTLRWRLTLVYSAVAVAVGVLLLLLAVFFADRALSAVAGVQNPNGIAVQLPDGSVLSFAAFQEQLRQAALSSLFRKGLVALVVLSALGVLVSYLLAGRVLRPLQRITSTAQRLSAEQLDERIDLPGPEDELKVLADTFDAMLGRLQASFEAQRRFVADASHELRTPLAVMRTEVEVALADPDASVADLRLAATVVRDATERADRLVDSLLLLARSDRLQVDGLPVTDVVELSVVADQALRAVVEGLRERRLSVDVAWGQAAVLGDPGLLERLAGNLVENAVTHNVDDGFVHVATGTDHGSAWLRVTNSGAPVPPTEVPDLFEPFRRHGTARTHRRGAGLGLAIVRAVATAHGGTATASARPEGGLVVDVVLPAQVARPLVTTGQTTDPS